MRSDFVPFEVELNFSSPTTETGTFVLEKDNPSGLPENANKLEIPIRFAKDEEAVDSKTCMRTGCSGQICFDQKIITTCEFRCKYACYRNTICEV